MSDSRISLFPGASGNAVEGNHFNIQQNINGTAHGLDMLLQRCCLEAQLDANERFDPPRCDPATRLKITQEIMDWITSDEASASVLVLHGSAGAGKSALEQSIAERCKREGRLASSFFLSRTSPTPGRRDGNAVIPTMVYQLGQVFPCFGERVVKEIEKDPGIFKLSREALMNHLFVNNFNVDFHLPRTALPRLIAIDGLDECNDRDIQRDLLHIIAAIVPSLPYPFCFFIACRPESHLMAIVNHDPFFQSAHARRLDLGDASDIDNDVRTFLMNEFQKIRNTHRLRRYIAADWPQEDVISRLVQKASGQFIFADTVAKFISSAKHRPQERLQIILGLLPPQGNENPFALLDALYKYIFSCVEDMQTVGHILGIIHLLSVRVKHPSGSCDLDSSSRLFAKFCRPSQLERILGLKPGEIELKFDELASVVSIPSRRDKIKVMHASLFDFLLDSSRSGPYALDLSLAHQTFAECAESQMSFKSKGLDIVERFLYHSSFARLSPSIVEFVGKVSLFLVHFPEHQAEEWWLYPSTVRDYNRLLGLMSNIFEREDFPHGPHSICFIQAVAGSWNRLKLEGAEYYIEEMLTPELTSPEGTELGRKPLTSNKSRISRRIKDELLRVFKKGPTTWPRYIGEYAYEPAEELVSGAKGLSGDVGRSLCATRLLFWTQRVHRDPSQLSFQAIARFWVGRAFYSLRDQWKPSRSNMAVVFFVATLLRHCTSDGETMTSYEIINDYMDHGLAAQRSASELGAFPKIWEFYDTEERAFRHRVGQTYAQLLDRSGRLDLSGAEEWEATGLGRSGRSDLSEAEESESEESSSSEAEESEFPEA